MSALPRTPQATPLKIICFLFDPHVGGPTIRARAVYERLMARGHRVRIAFPRGEGTAVGYIAERGIPVDRLAVDKPVLPRKRRAFAKFALTLPVALWRTVAYLRRRRPDLIHVNGAFDLVPVLAGRLAGVPVVWHLNDMMFGAGLSRFLGRLVRALASRIVVSSLPVAGHYGIPEDRVYRLFVPVDLERFRPRPPRAPGPAPILGIAANWNAIKGQDHFVEVICRLRQLGYPVRGVAIGRFLDSQRGYWQPILERIDADGLEDVIDIRGFTADMAGALAGIDILLVTSRSESGPMVTVEAMACGVPQVVFDVGDVRTMLAPDHPAEAAGIVVPGQDVEAMVAGVRALLDDPERYLRQARAARDRAARHYGLDECVVRHLEVYRAAAFSAHDLEVVDAGGEGDLLR